MQRQFAELIKSHVNAAPFDALTLHCNNRRKHESDVLFTYAAQTVWDIKFWKKKLISN